MDFYLARAWRSHPEGDLCESCFPGPSGTLESSPAIYRRVRIESASVPAGRLKISSSPRVELRSSVPLGRCAGLNLNPAINRRAIFRSPSGTFAECSEKKMSHLPPRVDSTLSELGRAQTTQGRRCCVDPGLYDGNPVGVAANKRTRTQKP